MVAQLVEMTLVWGLRGSLAWYVTQEYVFAIDQKFGAVLRALDGLN